jgi:hypothetical protein
MIVLQNFPPEALLPYYKHGLPNKQMYNHVLYSSSKLCLVKVYAPLFQESPENLGGQSHASVKI